MQQLSSYLRLLRPKDWVKNFFIFAPLFFTPNQVSWHNIYVVFVAFVIFCVVASSIYILNDLIDYKSDRLHSGKINRPIVSGQVSLFEAKILFIVLSLIGLISSYFWQFSFFICISLYYILNIAYCFSLRTIAIIDIFIIATGFVIRVSAGALLIHVLPSEWLLLCTGLLALFLALAKRRDDLVRDMDAMHRPSLWGYNLAFLDACIIIVLSALFIAYMVYTTLESTVVHLGTAHFYYTIPLVLLGIFRYLQLTLVTHQSGSPTEMLYRDRALLSIVILWVLLSTMLIYVL